MSTISTLISAWEANRVFTLGTLDRVAKLGNPQDVLRWRPAPGRAHVGWQLMHIAVTEELFATERLGGKSPCWPDLVPRFKGGSTPDDNLPALDEIRNYLAHSRQHLIETARGVSDSDLQKIPEAFAQRGWNLLKVLHVINWHECHHQGQAHITLNMFESARK